MTEQETQRTKDAALARAIRLKRMVNVTTEALNQTAETLEDIAKVLRSPQRRDGFVFDSHKWLNSEALYALIEEADTAQKDFDTANQIAGSLGELLV